MFRHAGYYFAALFVLALAAFWKTYVTAPAQYAEPYTHVHALLMVLWFATLIAQPFLIRRERRAAHRAIGRASFVLVPFLALSILALAHARIEALDAKALAADAFFFYLPFSMTILLVVPWLLGIKHRHDVAVHARCMIATCLAGIDPILGRIIAFYFPPLPNRDLATLLSYVATVTILGVLIVRERKQRVGRAVFPFMLVLATLVYAGFFTLARTGGWQAFVEWYGALPLTP